jgi:hypothetical protein
MAAPRAVATAAGQGPTPHGQGGHGGGRHIAFGGQQGRAFAFPVSHGGTEPCVTACLNDREKGRLQTAS